MGSYDVIFTDGEVGKIKIKAPDNILPLIQTEVSDGLLKIGAEKNRYKVKEPIIIYVPVNSRLKQVDIKGSADIYSEKNLETKTLNVGIYGSGDARLTVDVSITGSGDVTIKGNPKKVKQKINGSGGVNVK